MASASTADTWRDSGVGGQRSYAVPRAARPDATGPDRSMRMGLPPVPPPPPRGRPGGGGAGRSAGHGSAYGAGSGYGRPPAEARPPALLPVVLPPPLVFVAVALVNVGLAPSAPFTLPTLATVLIRGFPTMAVATGVALVLAIVRWAARR